MKLYDIPRDSYVKIIDDDVKLPIANYLKEENSKVVLFHHIDGMYSLCEDVEGNLVHLAAWTEVEIASEIEFKHQLT